MGLFSVSLEHEGLLCIGRIGRSVDYLISAYRGIKDPEYSKTPWARKAGLLVVEAKTISSIIVQIDCLAHDRRISYYVKLQLVGVRANY